MIQYIIYQTSFHEPTTWKCGTSSWKCNYVLKITIW
uniref:Uncharacterized protein n=1 Tax=Arundo donax TaxID=35708 RepID=A0A0A8Z5A7_ARUDO